MPYSLYNPTIEVVKPKFWIARPNKQVLTRVKELDELATLKVELGGINEISGEIPYLLNRNGKTINNPHIKYIKNKYLIKMQFMDNTEWFVIEDVSKNGNEEKDTISFTAYNLAYNLRGKKLYNDKFEGKTPREVMDELLSGTSWATGRISTIIGGKIRSFDEFSPNTNTIEAINTISESYAGIPSYDSEDKLINLLHKDDYAIVSNLMINDKNYIQSYKKDSDTNDIVTRLFATGEDGLSIAGVTATGKMYIDKFDWYMYPFKRDENKKVLSHSDYMSDELCHAILDQQEAIKEIEPLVKEKQDEIDELIDSLTSLEDTEDEMRLKYETVEGILDAMRANDEYEYSEFLTNGNTYSFNFRKGYYVGQARAKNGSSSAQLSFDGAVRSLTSDWTTFKYDMNSLDPLSDGQSMTVISLTGGNCEFYIVRVPEEEYNTYTDTQIKEKYNGIYWKEQYDSAKNGYESKQNEIDTLQSELEALYKSVGDDHFYTLELLREKDEFIHVYYWEEPTHTDVQELYDDAVEKLKELHKPKLSIETDIFNFLASLNDKRNWKKLILGSRVRVKHSRLDEYNEVILTGIEYDFTNDNIKLTLEDIKDLNGDEYAQMIMQGANASSTLNLNKKIWDDTVAQSKTFDEILNSEYDATKRRILAGVNESVELSNRGLRIINPDYPKQMLIGTAGVLGLSKSGGQTFETAISPDGIYADKLIGRLIIGQKLLIRDDDGTIILNGSLQTIKDRNGITNVELGEYAPNKFGLKIYNGAIEIVGGLSEKDLSSGLSSKINNAVSKGEDLNGVKIDTVNGIVVSTSKNTLTMNASKGLEIKRKSDNKSMFTVDSNTGNVTFAGNLSAVGGTFTGTLQGVNGTFTGNLSAVGGTFSGTLQGANGTFTGTLSGNTITGATINGGTINGTTFITNDSSNDGQIRISGSTFTSTSYYDSGQYVQIKNGGLIVRTIGEQTGTYQTIDMSGNYGLKISSTVSPSSYMRLDVYETESSYSYPVYKLHATGNYPDLRIISDNSLMLRGTTVNVDSYNFTVKNSTVITESNIRSYAPSPDLSGYATKTWVNESSSPTSRLNNLYNFGGSIGAWNIGTQNINSANGAVKIGSTGNIVITGKLTEGSNRDIKKNINSFTKSGLDIINYAKIREFNYLVDVDGVDMPRIGLIADEAPLEVLDIDDGGYGVLIFEATWIGWKAIQELSQENLTLKEQVSTLEIQIQDVLNRLTILELK